MFYSYYAVSYSVDQEGRHDVGGKYSFASAERVSQENNILRAFLPSAKCASACKTFKEAKEVAKAWNIAYRNNGRLPECLHSLARA